MARRKTPKQIIKEFGENDRVEEINVYDGNKQRKEGGIETSPWDYYYDVSGWIENRQYTFYLTKRPGRNISVNHSSAISYQMRMETNEILLQIEPKLMEFIND